MGSMLEKAIKAKRESKYVDFKESWDGSPKAWLELIKDIVSMANSGGGAIAFCVANDGTHSGWNPSPLLAIDPADLTNRIRKYTGEDFSGFDFHDTNRDGDRIAVIEIAAVSIPMVFENPGTALRLDGKQDTIFGRGTVYFRHGAKSEPARSGDLRAAIDRQLDQVRSSWLGNIRKVTEAPAGSQVTVVTPAELSDIESGKVARVRLVEDPEAVGVSLLARDVTHPYRQKEAMRRINERLAGRLKINQYDMQGVKRAYAIQSRPEFAYKPAHYPLQYSEAYVDWVIEQYENDSMFFKNARTFVPVNDDSAGLR